MSRSTYSAISLLFLVVLYTGCDLVTHPELRETTLFSSLETRVVEPIEVKDELPPMTSDEKAAYTSIADGFKKNASERLGEPEVRKHIERIDQIFIRTGRYLELVKIYEDDYKLRGVKSLTIGRLAFAYVRIGQNASARPIIDQMLEYAPSDPTAHFVDATYWLRQPRTLENLGQAMESFDKTLNLSPNFIGYEGINAPQIKQQLDQLRQVVPKDWRSKVDLAKEEAGEPAEESGKPTEESGKPTEESGEPTEESGEPTEESGESGDPTEESGEPANEEKPEETEQPVAKTKPQTHSKEQRYLIMVAQAEIALNEGRERDAETKFLEAQALNPGGFEAEFGHLRAGWRVESARNNIAIRIRELAGRELTAQQAYNIGLFVFSNMSDRELTKKLWTSAKEKDPAFAKRVDLDSLMSDL